MKKITASVLAMIGIMVLTVSPVSAVSTSTPAVSVYASVPSAIGLTLVMRKNDWQGAVITSMDFGELRDIGTGTLRSSPTSTTGTGAAACFLSTNTHGLPFVLSQTGTALATSTASLPSGACTVVPVYANGDNNNLAKPTGATLGSAGSWVGNRTLYTSETGIARSVTVQGVYSVTDDPAAGATSSVPMGQAGGSYNAQVTFTLTTV